MESCRRLISFLRERDLALEDLIAVNLTALDISSGNANIHLDTLRKLTEKYGEGKALSLLKWGGKPLETAFQFGGVCLGPGLLRGHYSSHIKVNTRHSLSVGDMSVKLRRRAGQWGKH